MERFIKREAAKLKGDVLREFLNRKEWDTRSLSQMIDERIGKFNKRVQKRLEKRIYDDILGDFGESLPEAIPTPAKLSEMLYRNAKEAVARLTRIFRDYKAGKKTLIDLARAIYEGYGFRSKEMLEVRKKLPKYVNDYLRHMKTQKDFEREISRLRTRPLRTAYRQISEAVEKHNQKAIDKATQAALEEKARYYANRIAQTEQQRAINLARAKQYLEDDEIELVKYRMSSKHPMVDICDYYANLDVGYGKGIVPKDKMVALPLHPHCMCRYDPYYKKAKKRKVKDPEKETLKQFSKWERSRILGGYDALRRWEGGESVEDIFNSARPKYPVLLASSFLHKRIKQEYTKQKTGYFDEKFEPVGLSEACSKLGIDKNDLDEIIKRTRFMFESAVYYTYSGKRLFVEGHRDHVDIPIGESIRLLIHSHPSGTSFSAQDILSASDIGADHIVVFNDTYLYSLKQHGGIDIDDELIKNKANEIYNRLLSLVAQGKITQSQMLFSINHKVWKEIAEQREGVFYEYYKIKTDK